MKFRFAAHPGSRRVYADSFSVFGSKEPMQLPCSGAAAPGSAGTFFAAVCDGVGEERGREASAAAIRGICQRWEVVADERESVPLTELALGLADAGRAALPSQTHASTLALAVIRRDAFACLNIGDSPIFLIRGRNIAQELSVRDNLYFLKERNRFDAVPEEKSLLIAHLGSFRPPHVCEGTLSKGDRLLLCTDGMDPLLPDRAIGPEHPDVYRIGPPLRAALRSRRGLQARLALAARKSQDNTTAIVLEV